MTEIPNDQVPPVPENQSPPNHWHLLRDVVALQFKLALDGVLDLLMSPVSIFAAIAGVVLSPDEPGRFFYRVLEFGHRSDRWINLYSAGAPHPEGGSSDAYVNKVETMIKNEYDKGGVVKSIKDNTDGLIDKLRKR